MKAFLDAVPQPLQNCGDPPCQVEILEEVAASGPQISEVGRFAADLVEPVQRKGNARFIRQGGQVKDRVGRPAQGHVHGDGVVEGLGGEDLSGRAVFPHRVHEGHATLERDPSFLGGNGRRRSAKRQGQSEHLGQAVHRIGRVEALAGSGARTGTNLQVFEFFLGDLAPLPSAHSLEGVSNQGQPAPLVMAGQHRPGGQDDRGDIQAGGGHQHARGDLVAVGDQDEAIQGVCLDDRLHHVCDQFPEGQGIEHALVAHGDPVTEGPHVEQKGIPSPCVHPLLHEACQLREVQVARDQVGRRIPDPDKGLVDFALR